MNRSEGLYRNPHRSEAYAKPLDAVRIRKAVMDAVLLGYGRGIKNDEAVDLDLIELEQKKGKRTTRAQNLRMASRLGLGARETMQMRPGLVFDMWELLILENRKD